MLIFKLFNHSEQQQRYEGYVHISSKISPDLEKIPAKEVITYPSLIIYGDYIIEFILRENFVDGSYIGSDTTGYVFVNMNKGTYVQYASLDSNAEELAKGTLKDRKSGYTFYYKDLFKDALNLVLKDTTINGEKCKIAKAVDDNAKFHLTAMIRSRPSNFPVQFSKSLSDKTNGGFVFQLIAVNTNEGGIINSEINYEQKELSGHMHTVIEAWKARSD